MKVMKVMLFGLFVTPEVRMSLSQPVGRSAMAWAMDKVEPLMLGTSCTLSSRKVYKGIRDQAYNVQCQRSEYFFNVHFDQGCCQKLLFLEEMQTTTPGGNVFQDCIWSWGVDF